MIKQRYAVKFCVGLEKSGIETLGNSSSVKKKFAKCSKKGLNEQIQSKSHAHRFLRCQGSLRICTEEQEVNDAFYLEVLKKTGEKGQSGEDNYHGK